jgi:hypothetical protein
LHDLGLQCSGPIKAVNLLRLVWADQFPLIVWHLIDDDDGVCLKARRANECRNQPSKATKQRDANQHQQRWLPDHYYPLSPCAMNVQHDYTAMLA